jgi:hypothetical protein
VNELVNVPISPWYSIPAAVGLLALTFALAPGVLLHLGVLIYPKGDARRQEFRAELYMVPFIKRPFWVAGTLVRCLFEGLPRRLAQRRERQRRERTDNPDTQETYETLPSSIDDGPLPILTSRSKSVTSGLWEPEIVKRRKFLAHAAAVAIGGHVLRADAGLWTSNPVPRPVPYRIGMTDVRQIEAAVRAFRSLDYQYGGGFRRDAVVAQLSKGQRMLGAWGSDVVKQRLYVVLADLHNLAGWTSFEVGLIDSARNHLGCALEFARAGDSNQLVSSLLCRMGQVHLHEEFPDHALTLFELSQRAAQDSGSAVAISMSCTNQSWAHGMMGDDKLATRLIGRAQDEFARANHGEAADWVKFFNEDDVYSMIGTVHTVLAQKVDARHTKYAVPALTRALESYGDELSRNKAFDLSSLATNHLLNGDIDHGTKIGHQAVDLARHLKSCGVKDGMMSLKMETDKRRTNNDARDLGNSISQLYESGPF